MWQDIIWVGLLNGGVTLVTKTCAYCKGHAHWQTMVFTVRASVCQGYSLTVP